MKAEVIHDRRYKSIKLSQHKRTQIGRRRTTMTQQSKAILIGVLVSVLAIFVVVTTGGQGQAAAAAATNGTFAMVYQTSSGWVFTTATGAPACSPDASLLKVLNCAGDGGWRAVLVAHPPSVKGEVIIMERRH
jgi:hypothetical protein